jgi:hypothetical protein
MLGRPAALALLLLLAACGGRSSEEVADAPAPATTAPARDARALPPHRDSASAFEVTVAPDRARVGETVSVIARVPPGCAPLTVIVADSELQGMGRAGNGKQVPHQLVGRALRVSYTVAPDDSEGLGLFIVRCTAGGDGLGVFRIVP